MLLYAFAARNTRQVVELHVDWNIARGCLQQCEKLRFGVVESGVGHVVDERDADATSCRRTIARCRRRRWVGTRILPFQPMFRNAAAVYHQGHDGSPKHFPDRKTVLIQLARSGLGAFESLR